MRHLGFAAVLIALSPLHALAQNYTSATNAAWCAGGRDRGHDRDGRGFAFGFSPGYDYGYSDYSDYGYDDGCYQARQVPTRYGWRWRRVWVCD